MIWSSLRTLKTIIYLKKILTLKMEQFSGGNSFILFRAVSVKIHALYNGYLNDLPLSFKIWFSKVMKNKRDTQSHPKHYNHKKKLRLNRRNLLLRRDLEQQRKKVSNYYGVNKVYPWNKRRIKEKKKSQGQQKSISKA